MTSSGLTDSSRPQRADRPPRGILGVPGRLPYRVTRRPPSAALSWCIDRFWTSEWELPPGRAVTARVLPHPTVNLTWESYPSPTGPGAHPAVERQLIITGVARGVFTRTLSGTDRAFGIKLRPGVARLLIGLPVGELSGSGQPAAAVWSASLSSAGQELQDALSSASTDDERIGACEVFFGGLAGPPERLRLVQQGVHALIEDPTVRRVTDVTDRLGVSERTLQRLFGEYLGLSPGWVLRRGRLHAAAERLIQLTAAGSDPAGSDPAGSDPAGSTPAGSTPAGSTPAGSTPAGSTPAGSTTARSGPAGRGRGAVLADVAAEYGYADQAHLTGDFTKIIGMPPSSWLNTLIAEHAVG